MDQKRLVGKRQQDAVLIAIYLISMLLILIANLNALFTVENDEAFFLMGSNCLDPNGCLIYRDLLDVKLPALFILVKPLEMLIAHDYLRLSLVALGLIVVANALLFLIAQRLYGRNSAMLTSVIFFFFEFSPVFLLYTIRQEILLAIIVLLCTYIALFMRKNRAAHLLLFFLLGAIVMIKVIYGLIALPFLYFIWKNEKDFLLKNAHWFLLSLSVIPLVSLFIILVPGALQGYLLYATKLCPPRLSIYTDSLFYSLYQLFSIIPIFLCVLVFFIITKPKDEAGWLLYWLFACSFLSAITPLSGSNIYSALFGAAVPFFAIFATLMLKDVFALDLEKMANARNYLGVLLIGLVIFAILVSAVAQATFIVQPNYDALVLTKITGSEVQETCAFLEKNSIPEDTLLAFPLDTEVYYFCDRKPAGRNVLYYLPAMPETEAALKQELNSTLQTQHLKYVLVYSKNESNRVIGYAENFIAPILEWNNFTKVETLSAFDVYEKKK